MLTFRVGAMACGMTGVCGQLTGLLARFGHKRSPSGSIPGIYVQTRSCHIGPCDSEESYAEFGDDNNTEKVGSTYIAMHLGGSDDDGEGTEVGGARR